MPFVVSITQQDVFTKLRALVVDVIPAGVAVVQGLDNRTAMPAPSPGFVNMTCTVLTPHRTPVESWDHASPNPNAIAYEQGMLLRVQLDCYGAASQDWAVMLAALLRTSYACDMLAPVAPLFADNPIQAALTNAEEQYEQRWIVGANLQYNPVITTPMQFADSADIDLINVDVSYPP